MNKVEEQLQTQLQEEGWEVLHTGWPDFLCIRGTQTIFVEAKSINGNLTKEQYRVLNHLRSLGLKCFKWRPLEGLQPFDKTFVRKRKGNTLSSYIRNWVNNTWKQFHLDELDNDLGITSTQAKNLRRVVIKKLCDTGKLKRVPGLSRVYRRVQEAKEVNWQ